MRFNRHIISLSTSFYFLSEYFLINVFYFVIKRLQKMPSMRVELMTSCLQDKRSTKTELQGHFLYSSMFKSIFILTFRIKINKLLVQ